MNPWNQGPSLEYHTAAAELWMDLTGRTARATELTKEANGDMVADQVKPAPATRAPLVGAAAGGLVGAGLMGGLAHHGNKHLAAGAARVSRRMAALGGGTIGAGVGATLGTAYLIRKALTSPAEAPAKTGSADVGRKLLAYLREHPRAAAAAGAALLAVPAAGGGYLREKARHTAGRGGKSEYEIDNDLALAEHRARTEHAGTEASGKARLKERYLQLKEEAGVAARESPRKAGLAGALPYAVLAGTTGASLLPRLLR